MNALTLSAFALAMMLATPALAGHAETHESGWFEYQYNDDDDSVLYCNGLGIVPLGADLYLQDRPGPGQPYGTGLFAEGGGGTWIFQETNGLPGIQIGGGSILGEDGPTGMNLGGDDPYGTECPNGDVVVF